MTRRSIDLTGQTFGQLTATLRVVEQVNNRNRTFYMCECSCGNEVKVEGNNLSSGNSTKCVECRLSTFGGHNKTHGMSGGKSVEYHAWKKMKERCYNPNCKEYPHYGGRGIKVCKRWKTSFENFLNDMGTKPNDKDGRANYSLERKDTNKDYTPSNCEWATKSKQMRNTRRAIRLTYRGETLSVHDWAERLGVLVSQLVGRHRRGWSDADVITRPLRGRPGSRFPS